MTNDEILEYLVKNGLLSIRWQQLLSKHEIKSISSSTPVSSTPYPLIKFRKGIINESELFVELGIMKKDLFRFLVESRELLNFD